mmetsp:Transcript_40177/g.87797  ORF Transcript_40177/g.87797 Transcript_40177/m.87797 type:complete len:205 (+) Transcript_40177:115-729(+)
MRRCKKKARLHPVQSNCIGKWREKVSLSLESRAERRQPSVKLSLDKFVDVAQEVHVVHLRSDAILRQHGKKPRLLLTTGEHHRQRLPGKPATFLPNLLDNGRNPEAPFRKRSLRGVPLSHYFGNLGSGFGTKRAQQVLRLRLSANVEQQYEAVVYQVDTVRSQLVHGACNGRGQIHVVCNASVTARFLGQGRELEDARVHKGPN